LVLVPHLLEVCGGKLIEKQGRYVASLKFSGAESNVMG